MKTLDLHGYGVYEAVDLAIAFVKEAFEEGVEFVKIIHGAPDVRHHMHAQILGRGGIKWALRGMLSRGELSAWVYPRRSNKHNIGGGCMILKVRNAKTTDMQNMR